MSLYSVNICLFCHVPACTRDIFTEYYCDGKKEVYSDMLFSTFNVTVPQDTLNKNICDLCIAELQQTAKFKVKVLKSISHLTTVEDFKTEKDQYFNDFDESVSVEFDKGSQPLNTDPVYVIKLTAKNDLHEQEGKKHLNEEWSFEEPPSLLKEGQDNNIEIQREVKQKSESQNHKNLKENSLKLIFNSNLCLFKSLKTKFRCYMCKDAFLLIKDLREHSKIHSNLEVIKSRFNRLRGLSYQNADISNLECSKCRQTCLGLIELEKHLIEKHGEFFGDAGNFLIPYKLEDSFNCVLCNEKFNTYMRLSVHMNNHYSNNVCEICGNSYINRISLRIHLQSRHKEKKCSLCPETFLSNYARVRHMRACHDTCQSKRYCLICGKTFRYSYQLMEHKIQEHGAKRHLSKCSLCPKTFPNTQNLKIHVRSVHVRERNFPCQACDMRFFTRFDQKRHEQTHLDERLYACEVCESKFKGKDSLRRHLKRQHGNLGV